VLRTTSAVTLGPSGASVSSAPSASPSP